MHSVQSFWYLEVIDTSSLSHSWNISSSLLTSKNCPSKLYAWLNSLLVFLFDSNQNSHIRSLSPEAASDTSARYQQCRWPVCRPLAPKQNSHVSLRWSTFFFYLFFCCSVSVSELVSEWTGPQKSSNKARQLTALIGRALTCGAWRVWVMTWWVGWVINGRKWEKWVDKLNR